MIQTTNRELEAPTPGWPYRSQPGVRYIEPDLKQVAKTRPKPARKRKAEEQPSAQPSEETPR